MLFFILNLTSKEQFSLTFRTDQAYQLHIAMSPYMSLYSFHFMKLFVIYVSATEHCVWHMADTSLLINWQKKLVCVVSLDLFFLNKKLSPYASVSHHSNACCYFKYITSKNHGFSHIYLPHLFSTLFLLLWRSSKLSSCTKKLSNVLKHFWALFAHV